MKRNFIAISFIASLITNNAFAGTMGTVEQQAAWSWVGTLSAGPVWEDGGSTQSFYLTPEIEKTYVANRSTKGLFDGELFVGLQTNLSQILLGQLGLAVAATSNAALSGVIWDDTDPEFDNYTYSYQIQHTQIAAKGKILANMGYWFMPWVSASIGVGFNKASDFTNTPLIFEAVRNPDFSSHTQTAFSYTVGAGLQKSLNDHWQIGVGYEFADWGKSNLSSAARQTLNEGLSINHLYTNGVLFNLTYIS
jgi:opacity protein-like surface antigen